MVNDKFNAEIIQNNPKKQFQKRVNYYFGLLCYVLNHLEYTV